MSDSYWEQTGRPGDFGSLGPWTREETEYLECTDTAVCCLPVVRRRCVIGYVWASETEDAAGYVARAGARAVGFNAAGRWRRRLREARDAGFSAWEAVQLWVGEPEDSVAGAIPDDAEVLVLPNSQSARGLASGNCGICNGSGRLVRDAPWSGSGVTFEDCPTCRGSGTT